MHKFHSNTRDGEPFGDEAGTAFPSNNKAVREAVQLLGELLRDQPDMILQQGCLKMSVQRDDGKQVVTLNVTLELPSAIH